MSNVQLKHWLALTESFICCLFVWLFVLSPKLIFCANGCVSLKKVENIEGLLLSVH